MANTDTRAEFAELGPRIGALRMQSEAVSETVHRGTTAIASAQATLIALRGAGRWTHLSAEDRATIDDVGPRLLGAATAFAALSTVIADQLAENGGELMAEFERSLATSDVQRCAQAITVTERQTGELENRLETEGVALLGLVDSIGTQLAALNPE